LNGRLEMLDTALVVIDFQERFRGAVEGFDEASARAGVLVQAFREMGLPVVVTEQYPQGLGPTVDPVAEAAEGIARIEKTIFSAVRVDGFDLEGRSVAVVCGVEAHVCVAQTALDLLADGIEVHVVADAVASRSPFDRDTALTRLRDRGATVTTTEAVAFELLGGAAHPAFKAVQGLIK
jgi:nicotinamidase-related amidase